MDVLSKLWLYVFRYLNESELVFAAQVCFEWWKIIFRGPFMKDVELPEEIDLSGSGNLYQFIPLRLFTETRHLNLSSTSISNRHFQQIATVAKNLERLDISNCPGLDQICIFQANKDLDQLRHVDISGNHKFTILAIACLCSLENLQMLLAHGFKLTPEQLLFLTKTFSSVSSGTLQLETEDGFDAACVMNTFAEELFDDELLFTQTD